MHVRLLLATVTVGIGLAALAQVSAAGSAADALADES
jgi:hypothetical protein